IPTDVTVAVDLVAAGEVGLDLPGEIGLDLQEPATAHGEPADGGGGVSGRLPRRELERVGTGHAAVGAHVEEVLVRELRRAEVAAVLVHRVEIAAAVVVAAQL